MSLNSINDFLTLANSKEPGFQTSAISIIKDEEKGIRFGPPRLEFAYISNPNIRPRQVKVILNLTLNTGANYAKIAFSPQTLYVWYSTAQAKIYAKNYASDIEKLGPLNLRNSFFDYTLNVENSVKTFSVINENFVDVNAIVNYRKESYTFYLYFNSSYSFSIKYIEITPF